MSLVYYCLGTAKKGKFHQEGRERERRERREGEEGGRGGREGGEGEHVYQEEV